MNRSILIVICDFLLVSLVAFSNFDSPEPAPQEQRLEKPSAPPAEGRTEVVSALKTALEDERQSREKLSSELAGAQQTAQALQQAAQVQQTALTERDNKLRETEAQLRQVAQQKTSLEQQYTSAQRNIDAMQNALGATRSEARLSNEQVQALRQDLKKRQEESDGLRKQLTELSVSHSNVLAAKQQLDTRVQVVETEKKMTAEQLVAARSQIKDVQAEKAQLQANIPKLVAGVSNLASNSTALTQEIRDNRPIAANTLFNEFNQNRITLQFNVVKPGTFFGQDIKRREAQTILVTDGIETNALCHVSDTPFAFWPPGQEYSALSGFITRGYYSYKIEKLTFLAQDPRVVVVPIDPHKARGMGAKVYTIAKDPFKFGDAVLVGANDGYYGECKFQIDPTTPQYVKMDRSLFRGLIGKFNPSRGDLVLSKSGELLGIMVNKEYCAVISKIIPGATIMSGETLQTQQAGKILSLFEKQILSLPMKLQ